MRRLLPGLVVIFASAMSLPARGADPSIERQARALEKAAIEGDSLNLDYPKAIKKLSTAISKCDGNKCDAPLKAALLRDLGAMLIMRGAIEPGRESFAKALALDPSLELDPAYKTAMLSGLWDDVKRKARPPGAGANAFGGESAGGMLPGDFTHVPPKAQLVRTALPLFVEHAHGEKLLRVVAKYRAFGTEEWKSAELKRTRTGFAGYIPCEAVVEGTMEYFIEGYGSSRDPIATSGTRDKPYDVDIATELAGPPPSLPGQRAPKQCGAPGGSDECTPDFPGCHGKKLADEPCEHSDDCESRACDAGKCGAVTRSTSTSTRRIWIGVAGSLDVIAFPAATDVCVVDPNGMVPPGGAGYRCFDPATAARFPGDAQTAANIVRGTGDRVGSGLGLGNLRLMASIDYALSANVMLGARAGFVLLTDPATNPGPPFPPLHLEARLTYFFGDGGYDHLVAPLMLGAVGVGEFDTSIGVRVGLVTGPPKSENAWLTAGPLFAAIGGGARFRLDPRVALTATVKLEAAFGGTAGVLEGVAPELGMQFGL